MRESDSHERDERLQHVRDGKAGRHLSVLGKELIHMSYRG